jgi:hypothetical protein
MADERVPAPASSPQQSNPGPVIVFPQRAVVPRFTLEEAFTHSNDPSQKACNEEKAARALMYLLEWASELVWSQTSGLGR